MKTKYQLLGRCGIFCGTDCEIYQAAHFSDAKVKEREAKNLGAELGITIDPASLRCEGCQGPREHMWLECRICLIRQCGKERGVKICTECEEYPCPVLRIWLTQSKSAPGNLRSIEEVGFDTWFEKKMENCKSD